MRKALGAIVLVAGSLIGTSSAQAQPEGPWCAIVGVGTGSVREICHFRTFAACQAEVISGNRGTCGHNPRYAGGGSVRRSSKRRSRHRH